MATIESIYTTDVVGIQGPAGVPGDDGDGASPPPHRTVSGATDTPTSDDDKGTLDFTSSSAITVTANDLGNNITYAVWPLGTGQITVAPGAGVTLQSGSANSSFKTPRRYAPLVIRCLGNGTVIVLGEQAVS